jgi:uncharacterized protein involved in response to NO
VHRAQQIPGRPWPTPRLLGECASLGGPATAPQAGRAVYATRFAIGLVIFLIVVVGGRIVPSFTRNWLMRREPGRLPVPFDRADTGGMVRSALALLLWAVRPEGRLTAAALAAGALELRLAGPE